MLFIAGFSLIDLTTRDGMRWSAAEGYLRPATARPNLHVVLNAHVTKVHTDLSPPHLSAASFIIGTRDKVT